MNNGGTSSRVDKLKYDKYNESEVGGKIGPDMEDKFN